MSAQGDQAGDRGGAQGERRGRAADRTAKRVQQPSSQRGAQARLHHASGRAHRPAEHLGGGAPVVSDQAADGAGLQGERSGGSGGEGRVVAEAEEAVEVLVRAAGLPHSFEGVRGARL